MNAKERILHALGRRDVPKELPAFDIGPMRFSDVGAAFSEALEAAGGETVESRETSAETIAGHFVFEGRIVDTRESVTPTTNDRNIGLLIVEAEFGVAENGAVWIDPKERYPREVLTLAENLAVVLKREAIVPTMHEAYERIDFAEISYALFMAGPSKTADIEQALVIGAHGAIGMKVFLEGEG